MIGSADDEKWNTFAKELQRGIMLGRFYRTFHSKWSSEIKQALFIRYDVAKSI
jgi:hypothetical protein